MSVSVCVCITFDSHGKAYEIIDDCMHNEKKILLIKKYGNGHSIWYKKWK